MKIDRQELQEYLEAVSPGLSQKEIIEQSNHFVFLNDKIITFNDEVACSQEFPTEGEGAVLAAPLLSLLNKLQDEEIDLTWKDKQLIIKGKNRRAGLKIVPEVYLPIDSIEEPKKWKSLPDDFIDAINKTHKCASNNETRFELTCVHFTPDFIEACDSHQLLRYNIKMDVEESILVRKDAIKFVLPIEATHFCETKTWVHFKNKEGLILSCRRYVEEYHNLNKLVASKGKKAVLPKSMKEAAETAAVFSQENPDNQVIIHLESNKLKIKSEGTSGWYWEVKKAKYEGKAIEFTIPPDLLVDLLSRSNKCIIGNDLLKITGENYTYVSVLGKVAEE
jgi:DNA polymerase III sliding clamp (beta) subunit (PCNA family)